MRYGAHSLAVNCKQPTSSSSIHSPKAQILEFHVLIQSVLRAFASQAALFDAAERRDLGRDNAVVDADDATLQCFRDPPYALNVAAIEVASKTEFRVVRQTNHFPFVIEANQRRNRAERFFAHCQGIGCNAD